MSTATQPEAHARASTWLDLVDRGDARASWEADGQWRVVGYYIR